MKNDLLYCDPVLALYDGEGQPGEGQPSAGQPGEGQPSAGQPNAGQPVGGQPNAGGKPKVFTQDDVNRFMAEDRRKNQQKVAELEGAYKQALENQNLTEQQRVQLQDSLESFQAQFRTKEENLKHEYEKFKSESTKTSKMLAEERDSWKTRYETTEVRRAIQDAAIKGEAYRSEHILAILQPLTKMVPILDQSGKPTGELAPRVHYPSTDAKTSEPITVVITADEAVSYMKQKPDEYGYLFKSNAQGGIGSSNGTGSGLPGKGGKIDVSQLTHAQYRELRKKNPSALGLK